MRVKKLQLTLKNGSRYVVLDSGDAYEVSRWNFLSLLSVDLLNESLEILASMELSKCLDCVKCMQ